MILDPETPRPTVPPWFLDRNSNVIFNVFAPALPGPREGKLAENCARPEAGGRRVPARSRHPIPRRNDMKPLGVNVLEIRTPQEPPP